MAPTRVCIKRNINEWKKGKHRKEKWNYNEKEIQSLHGRNFCKAISITLRQLNWFSMVRHKINEKLRGTRESMLHSVEAAVWVSEWVSETMNDSISCSTYSFLWLTRKQNSLATRWLNVVCSLLFRLPLWLLMQAPCDKTKARAKKYATLCANASNIQQRQRPPSSGSRGKEPLSIHNSTPALASPTPVPSTFLLLQLKLGSALCS